jgi:hypothetical protein
MISALVVSFTAIVSAGDRISLRAIGMGRAAVAATRGTDAIGINPANIAISDIGHFNLSLVNSSFRVSTELFTYDIYQKYFTGVDTGGTKRAPKHLTDQDKDDIRSQLPEDGLTKINVESMIAGLSFQSETVGGIGFAVIEHLGTEFAFSQDFFDMAYLKGLPSDAKYVFDGTSFNAWWYREYNVSYGRKIPLKIPFVKNFYAGVAIKSIQGFGIFQTIKNISSIENKNAIDTGKSTIIGNFDFMAQRAGVNFFNNDDPNKGSVTFFPDPVGHGTGFDLGFSAELFNGTQVGLSITDIGKITWDKNVKNTSNTGGGGVITFTGYTNEIQDSVNHVIKGKSSVGESFSTTLPTVLRLGAAVQSDKLPFLKFMPGRMLIAAEYAQGLNKSLGNTTKPRFSLGMEYRIIPVIPLRTGFLFGGGDKFRWAFGFGIDARYFSFDLGTDNFGMAFSPKNFNVFSLSLGFKVRV